MTLDVKKPRTRDVVLLFGIALVFRLALLACFDHDRAKPDSTGYHHLAVNVAKGHGYSYDFQEPFTPYFFREPGYPYYLSMIYRLSNVIWPIKDMTADDYDIASFQIRSVHPEIRLAKVSQTIVDSASVVLTYLLLLHVSSRRVAFLSALLLALYYHYAFFSLFLLRETLVVFLLLVLNVVYLKYLRSPERHRYLLFMGALYGLLILIFQVHFLLIPVFFCLTLYHHRQHVIRVAWHTVAVAAVALAMSAPRIVEAYKICGDWRIVKTFGNSFTYEMVDYVAAGKKACYYGKTTQNERQFEREWNASDQERFSKSYSGWYTQEAKRLKAATAEPRLSAKRIRELAVNLRRSLFLTQVNYFTLSNYVKQYGVLGFGFGVLIPVGIGLAGLFGLLLYGRRYLPFLIAFVSYAPLFIILGNETRRMIILQPFFMFFIVLFAGHAYGLLQARQIKKASAP